MSDKIGKVLVAVFICGVVTIGGLTAWANAESKRTGHPSDAIITQRECDFIVGGLTMCKDGTVLNCERTELPVEAQ